MAMKQKSIHLNALDLDVNIPERISYSDEGFVDSVHNHSNFLLWKYTGQVSNSSEEKNRDVHGRMFLAENSLIKSYVAHVFYKSNPNPLLEMFVRGHEETHFLHAVKRLGFLEKEMRKSVGIDLEFNMVRQDFDKKYERKEAIADLGGFFTLHKRYGIEGINNLPEYFKRHQLRNLYLETMKKTLDKIRAR